MHYTQVVSENRTSKNKIEDWEKNWTVDKIPKIARAKVLNENRKKKTHLDLGTSERNRLPPHFILKEYGGRILQKKLSKFRSQIQLFAP